MHRPLRLRAKLLLSFAVLLVFTVAVGALGLVRLSATARSFDEVVQEQLLPFALLHEAALDAERINLAMEELKNADSGDERASDLKHLLALEARLRQNTVSYLETSGRDVTTGTTRLDGQLADVGGARDHILDLVAEGKTAEADDVHDGEFGEALQAIIEDLAASAADDQARATEAAATSQRSFRSSLLLTTGAVALAIIAGLAIALWMASRIAGGARAAARAATSIASGELDHDIEVHGGDEIGDLGLAFRGMTGYLRETAAAAESVAGNDLTVTLRPRSTKDVLRTAFAGMVAGLREAIGDTREAAAELTITSEHLNASAGYAQSAAGEISETMRSVAARAAEQAEVSAKTRVAVETLSEVILQVGEGARDTSHRVERATATIREMGAAIDDSGEAASEAREAASASAEAASAGARAVQETIAGMRDISSAVELTATSVSKLGEKGLQIDGIVRTIADIAAQTNLLALNAAIEAARAGDSGRGFAVVADEVRALAERSAQATGEISALIEEIRRSTDDAVAAMDEGTERARVGTELAKKSGEALTEIASAVQTTRSAVTRIDAASQLMVRSSSSVSAAMDEIGAIAARTLNAAEEMTIEAGSVADRIAGMTAMSAENSTAAAEVSDATARVSSQVEDIVESASALERMAAGLNGLVGRFELERREPTSLHGRRAA